MTTMINKVKSKQCKQCGLNPHNGRGIIKAYIPTTVLSSQEEGKIIDLCSSCLVDNYQSLSPEDKQRVQILA